MAMGEAPPETWSDELRRAGRVVFPVRRKRLLIQRGCFAAVFGLEPALSFDDWLDTDGVRLGSGLLSVVLVLTFVGLSVWQLVTQRPALTVDHEGIRYLKTLLPWSEIGTIGPAHGPGIFRILPITPANRWSRQLVLTQDNVRDLPTFATWLAQQLAARRTAAD
jgi:hypothetical protein